MSGQTFSAGQRVTGTQLTNIQYQNEVNVSEQAVTSGTDALTSTSYVNMAGTGAVTSVSFTKVLTSTNIKVSMGASWTCTVNTVVMRIGALIDGVDYDVGGSALNTTITIGDTTGEAIITGIAAGTYTVQARWKRTGAGTATRNVNDWMYMTVSECA